MEAKHVRVGVAAIVRYGNAVLMGKRMGSHGAGTWSFPGGHLEVGESVAECASRELKEETGLDIHPERFIKLTFTNDVFEAEDKHYVTLYVHALWTVMLDPAPEPEVMEPTKCAGWEWFKTPPSPLFLPVQNLLATSRGLVFRELSLANAQSDKGR